MRQTVSTAQDVFDELDSIDRWLNNQFKHPADDPYARGYNDALLDLKNETKRRKVLVAAI